MKTAGKEEKIGCKGPEEIPFVSDVQASPAQVPTLM
jgi:hypothetical protein